MAWKLRKTVVMVGMMGAGKTAVGKAVSVALGVPFLDSDHEIEVAANMSIADIFARDGEAFFRKKESQIIERLLENRCGILSTGGGAFLNASNREMISARGVSVWLDADINLLWSRVKSKSTRPLLRSSNPRKVLGDLFEARVPLYEKADIAVVSEARCSIGEMAGRVIAALEKRDDVLEKLK